MDHFLAHDAYIRDRKFLNVKILRFHVIAARDGHHEARQFTIFHAVVVDGSIEDAEFEGKPTIKFKIRLVNADDTYPINYPWMYEQAAPAAAGVAGAGAAA